MKTTSTAHALLSLYLSNSPLCVKRESKLFYKTIFLLLWEGFFFWPVTYAWFCGWRWSSDMVVSTLYSSGIISHNLFKAGSLVQWFLITVNSFEVRMRILPSLFTLSILVLNFWKAWKKGITGSKVCYWSFSETASKMCFWNTVLFYINNGNCPGVNQNLSNKYEKHDCLFPWNKLQAFWSHPCFSTSHHALLLYCLVLSKLSKPTRKITFHFQKEFQLKSSS